MKSQRCIFKSYGHWGKGVLVGAEAAVFGCFVKSPEGFLNHMVIGAEGVLVGSLLLYLGAL